VFREPTFLALRSSRCAGRKPGPTVRRAPFRWLREAHWKLSMMCVSRREKKQSANGARPYSWTRLRRAAGELRKARNVWFPEHV